MLELIMSFAYTYHILTSCCIKDIIVTLQSNDCPSLYVSSIRF